LIRRARQDSNRPPPGLRRGTDVLKAMALVAKRVFVDVRSLTQRWVVSLA